MLDEQAIRAKLAELEAEMQKEWCECGCQEMDKARLCGSIAAIKWVLGEKESI